jgi:DNA-binding beta-propeller fold protein YncE
MRSSQIHSVTARFTMFAALAGAVGFAGCSAGSEPQILIQQDGPRPGDNNNGGGQDSNPEPNPSPEPDSNPEPFIPEEEDAIAFQAPRSSRNFIFVANSNLDTVAKIDGDTLEIVSVEVGDRPTVVQTNRSENLAVVLNEGSDEMTVIRAGNGDDDYVLNLALPPGMNNIALAPGADFALAWFDFKKAQEDEEFGLNDDSAPPFQDVALVDLEEGGEIVYNLTVGFQVVGVSFDDDGERAFVVTRTGISVVDMGDIQGDRAVIPVPVVESGLEDDIEREVAITGDGRFAFVRTAGLEGLNIVNLDTRELTLIALSDIPTDLDIIPGQDRALAVLRRTSELALLDLPGAIEDPESVRIIALGDEPAGLAELTPLADKALVFTSVEDRKAMTVVDLETETFETYPLRKGVRGVAIAPTGDQAIIFHNKADGNPIPGEPEDDFIAKSFAYSVFDINTGYTKIETVPTEAGEFVFSQDSQRVYLLLNDKAKDVRQVEIIDLTSFRTQSLRIGSPPDHIGLIPNDGNPKVYISQEHPVGRMTFIEEQSGVIKTVTGFELNSLIE